MTLIKEKEKEKIEEGEESSKVLLEEEFSKVVKKRNKTDEPISNDFLGAYQCKAMNNARSMLKVWPIIYGCHVTGALHSELAWSYGTDTFLTL